MSLGAIGMMDPARLRQPAQIAGLVRAMALRADLAAIEYDESTASRWAMAVAELWRDADAPSLRETASRMGALARAQ